MGKGFSLTSHPVMVQLFQGRRVFTECLIYCQAELLTVKCAQDANILEGRREGGRIFAICVAP